MRRTVVVIVPGIPPGANALHRMTHWQVRKSRDEWSALARDCAALALEEGPFRRGFGQPIRSAILEVVWRRKTKRRRDWDNLVASLKPLLDGIVAAGILEDDSTDHLSFGALSVEIAKANETVLIIRERAA